jgi:cell wall-associated NlpC family hydrolase
VTLSRRVSTFVFGIALIAGTSTVARAQDPGFSSSEKPFATISRMLLNQPARDSLIELARSQVGVRYKWGAQTPGKAFDCSGLVQWLMAKFDLDIPRTSREQVKEGIEIPRDSAALLPGDLLFFGRGRQISHVGIYVGDGKYVAAASRRKGVIEASLPTGRAATTWWKAVRRLFVHDTSVATPHDSSGQASGAS